MRSLAEERAQESRRLTQHREVSISQAMDGKRRDAVDRRLREAEDKEQRRAEIYALNALMRDLDRQRWAVAMASAASTEPGPTGGCGEQAGGVETAEAPPSARRDGTVDPPAEAGLGPQPAAGEEEPAGEDAGKAEQGAAA